MSTSTLPTPANHGSTAELPERPVEHLDVLIVGAGLSGIGAACHLRAKLSRTRRFAILEARDAIGGTWDLFRYPGIRSDSDMFTLGYSFRPVGGGQGDRRRPVDPAATSARPRATTASRARSASTTASCAPNGRPRDARWTVEAERTDTGETVRLTCGFLFTCTGYYRYDEGYTPDFEGIERFGGRDRPPAALARGPRLHRQARGRDRQRRDRGDARARDGGAAPRT